MRARAVRRRPRRARGFTLIEVLLASVLLASGMALAFATLRASTVITQRGEALSQRSERIRRREAQAPVLTDTEPALPAAPAQARIGDVLDTEEISIEIGPGLIVSALDQGRGLGQRITNLRLHIARAYGLILPDVRITDGTGFADGEYVIRLQGVVLPGIGEFPVQAVQALPYLLTVVLLAGFVGRATPPRASGEPYVKER